MGADVVAGDDTPRFDPYHRWLGIPPAEQPPDHYRLLAIGAFESDPDVIMIAADQRMAHLRTFQTSPHGRHSQRLLNEVAAARLCLLDPGRKAAYDEKLRQSRSAAIAGVWQEPFEVAADSDEQPRVEIRPSLPKPQTNTPAVLGSLACILLVLAGTGVWIASRLPSETSRQKGEAASSPRAAAGRAKGGTLEAPARPLATLDKETAWKSLPEDVWELDEKDSAEADQGVAKSEAMPVAATPGLTRPVELVQDAPAAEVAVTALPELGKNAFDAIRSVGAGDDGRLSPAPSPAPRRPEGKWPVPAEELQEAARGKLGNAYGFAWAKTPTQKSLLAEQLLREGSQLYERPEEQFVLLTKAMELAREVNDLELALMAAERLGERFEADALAMKEKALVEFAGRPLDAERVETLVKHASRVIDQALGQRRHDPAMRLAETAYTSTQHLQGRPFRKHAFDLRARVQEIQERYQAVQAATAAVQTAPHDADAHLLIGHWRCFTEGEWDIGLQHLAQGSDLPLKALSRQEIDSPPTAAEEQVRLADGWWDLAGARKGIERDALRLSAGYWYEQALPKLPSGLERLKVEQRLSEIAELRTRTTAPPRRRPPSPTAAPAGIWNGGP